MDDPSPGPTPLPAPRRRGRPPKTRPSPCHSTPPATASSPPTPSSPRFESEADLEAHLAGQIAALNPEGDLELVLAHRIALTSGASIASSASRPTPSALQSTTSRSIAPPPRPQRQRHPHRPRLPHRLHRARPALRGPPPPHLSQRPPRARSPPVPPSRRRHPPRPRRDQLTAKFPPCKITKRRFKKCQKNRKFAHERPSAGRHSRSTGSPRTGSGNEARAQGVRGAPSPANRSALLASRALSPSGRGEEQPSQHPWVL